MATREYVDFSGAEGQITPKSVVAEIWTHQAFMHVLVTCKNEEGQIKNKFARVAKTFLPI